MLSFITFAIVLSVLIFVHEFGHFIFAKRSGVKVERFAFGFGKKLLGIKRGDTEYCICAVPLGGYVKMAGEELTEKRTGKDFEFLSKPVSVRASIIAAGPILNYVLAFFVFIAVFVMGNPQMISQVGQVLEDYPAHEAGIKEGDKIVALDGEPISYWDEILAAIHANTGTPIDVSIERDGRDFEFRITPKLETRKNIFKQEVKVGLIGIAPSDNIEFVKHGLFESVPLAAAKVWNITEVTCVGLWRIATGAMSFRESVSGPVGIYRITARAAEAGFVYVLQILAIVSICLAIFNLLPIPVLDGGHLLFLAIEKVRGKPLSPKAYERAINVGLAFLILLMVFVFYNDFDRMGVFDKVLQLFGKK